MVRGVRACVLPVVVLFLVLESSWCATLHARNLAESRFSFGQKSVETHAKNLETNLQLMDSILNLVQNVPQDDQGKHLLQMGKTLLHRMLVEKPFATPNSASPLDLMLSSSLLTPTLTRAVSSMQLSNGVQLEELSACVRSGTSGFDSVVHNTTVICLSDLMEKSLEDEMHPISAASLDKMTSCVRDMSLVTEVLRVFRKCSPAPAGSQLAPEVLGIAPPTNSSKDLAASLLQTANSLLLSANTSQAVPGMHAGRPGGPDFAKDFATARNRMLTENLFSPSRRGATVWFTFVLSVSLFLCLFFAVSLWGLESQGMRDINNFQTGAHIASYWIEACEGIAVVMLLFLPLVVKWYKEIRAAHRFSCTFRTRSTFKDNLPYWESTHKMFHYLSFVESQFKVSGNIVHQGFHTRFIPTFEEWLADGPQGFDHTDVTFSHFDPFRALVTQFPICGIDLKDAALMKELEEVGFHGTHSKEQLNELLHAIYRFRVHKFLKALELEGKHVPDTSGYSSTDLKLIREGLRPFWLKMVAAIEHSENVEQVEAGSELAESMIHRFVLVALSLKSLLEFVDLEGECKTLNKDDGTPRGATESENRFYRIGTKSAVTWPVNPLFHSRTWECIHQLPGHHGGHESSSSSEEHSLMSLLGLKSLAMSSGGGSVDVPIPNINVEFTSHGNVEKGAVCLLKCQSGYDASFGTTVCDDLGGGGMTWSHLNAGIKMHGKGQMTEPGCCISGAEASQINPNEKSLHVTLQNHQAYFYFDPGFNRACLSPAVIDRYPTETMGFVMQACDLSSPHECDVAAEESIYSVLDLVAASKAHGSGHESSSEHGASSSEHDTTSTGHDTTSTEHDTTSTGHDTTSTEHDTTSTGHDTTSTGHDTTSTGHDTTSTEHDTTSTGHETASSTDHTTDASAHPTYQVNLQLVSGNHAVANVSQPFYVVQPHSVSAFLEIPFLSGGNPNVFGKDTSMVAIFNYDSRTSTGSLVLPATFAPRYFRLVSFNVFGVVSGKWFLRDLERAQTSTTSNHEEAPHH